MPISTVKPLLAEAEALLTRSGLRSTDELTDICGTGLGFFAVKADAYHDLLPFCGRVAPHFINELSGLVHTLKTARASHVKGFSFFGEVQHRAFALVEDMALFMREKKLRSGGRRQHPTEERIMAYFENSGNWPANNGEMVTDAYYSLIPVAVLHDLRRSAPEISRHIRKSAD